MKTTIMERAIKHVEKLSVNELKRLLRFIQNRIEDLEEEKQAEKEKKREVIETRKKGSITYQHEKINCGKESCRKCTQGPGHGPYWYAYWSEGGKTRSKYIGKDLG